MSPRPTVGRVLLGILLLIVGLAVTVVVGAVVSKNTPGPEQVRELVNALLCLGGGIAALLLVARHLLRVSPKDLGVERDRSAVRSWLLGSLGGIGLAGAAFLLALALDTYEVIGGRLAEIPWHLWAVGVVATAAHALFEELVFRAGLVGISVRRFPPSAAVLGPALLFGIAHLNNEGAGWLGAINVVLVGAAFGFLYLSGRPGASLALVAGLHFGWNQALYTLGIPVSGTVRSDALLTVAPTAGTSGKGDFGLEATPAATLILAGLLVFAILRHRRRSRPGRDCGSLLE